MRFSKCILVALALTAPNYMKTLARSLGSRDREHQWKLAVPQFIFNNRGSEIHFKVNLNLYEIIFA
jgi:hypothetical protein